MLARQLDLSVALKGPRAALGGCHSGWVSRRRACAACWGTKSSHRLAELDRLGLPVEFGQPAPAPAPATVSASVRGGGGRGGDTHLAAATAAHRATPCNNRPRCQLALGLSVSNGVKSHGKHGRKIMESKRLECQKLVWRRERCSVSHAATLIYDILLLSAGMLFIPPPPLRRVLFLIPTSG